MDTKFLRIQSKFRKEGELLEEGVNLNHHDDHFHYAIKHGKHIVQVIFRGDSKPTTKVDTLPEF